MGLLKAKQLCNIVAQCHTMPHNATNKMPKRSQCRQGGRRLVDAADNPSSRRGSQASSTTDNAAARLQFTGTQQTAGRNHQAAAISGRGGSISSRRGGNHQAGAVVICLFLTTTIVATRQGGRWLVDATGIPSSRGDLRQTTATPARREPSPAIIQHPGGRLLIW